MRNNSVESLRQLDYQIEVLERQLLDLKLRRNALVPLCRLPHEIISHILHLLQAFPQTDKRCIRTPWAHVDRNWVEYTRVCRRMRDVALETPTLWNLIECKVNRIPGRWAKLYAERAKECPLEISGPGYFTLNDNYSDSDSEAYHHSPLERFPSIYRDRARRMHYYRLSGSDPSEFCDIISTPLPRIEELHCDMGDQLLPSLFLGGMSTTLTYLNIHRVVFSVDDAAPDLPALRRLSLRETNITQQFVALLSHASRLEMLAITTEGEVSIIPPHSTGFACVSLPSLRALHIGSYLQCVSTLIRIIPTPTNDLYIKLGCIYSYPDDILEYMHRFWMKATGQQKLPAGRIEKSYNQHILTFGSVFAVKSAANSPRIFFNSRYSPDHVIIPEEEVDSLHIWCRSTNLGHFDANIQRIVVREVVYSIHDLPSDLDKWIRKRAEADRPLEMVQFIGCRAKGLREYAEKLRNDGVVGA